MPDFLGGIRDVTVHHRPKKLNHHLYNFRKFLRHMILAKAFTESLPLWLLAVHKSVRKRIGFRDFGPDRKSTRLNSSHVRISYAVFCLKKKKNIKKNKT